MLFFFSLFLSSFYFPLIPSISFSFFLQSFFISFLISPFSIILSISFSFFSLKFLLFLYSLSLFFCVFHPSFMTCKIYINQFIIEFKKIKFPLPMNQYIPTSPNLNLCTPWINQCLSYNKNTYHPTPSTLTTNISHNISEIILFNFKK